MFEGAWLAFHWVTMQGVQRCVSSVQFSSVQFSHSVLFNSLWPHGYSTPGFPVLHYLSEFPQTHVHWVNDAILCRPLLLQPSIFPASGSFLISQLLASGGQNIGASASASVLPMNVQGWFSLRLTSWGSLLSKGLSRVFSSITVWKPQLFGAQPSLWSNSHIHTWLLEKL